MENLTEGNLTIEVGGGGSEAIVCVWKGKSSDRNPGQVLGPYFQTLVDQAAGDDVALEMHFDKLDHFNSSTITALIKLIQSARAKSVRLVMAYDQSLKWQKLSFDALRVFEKSDKLFQLRPV